MMDKLYNTSFVKQKSVNLKARLNRYAVLTIAIQRMSNFIRYCVVANCSNKVNLAINKASDSAWRHFEFTDIYCQKGCIQQETYYGIIKKFAKTFKVMICTQE